MSIKIIEQRILEYQPQNELDKENALKEVTQEITLSALARTGFFKSAVFQGGTCLRIFYGLNRFSEDLDFSLQKPNPAFHWEPYLQAIKTELELYGYQIQIQDRSAKQTHVKVGFLKDDSIGKIISFRNQHSSTASSIRIKLEIDTHPPALGQTEQKYLDFPVTMPVLCHDLPTLFAGKSHALLCREWEKGRDWYDFIWYVGKRIVPNFSFLTSAIHQAGPWKHQGIQVDNIWYLHKLKERIEATDWKKQKQDIMRFLKTRDVDLLEHWSTAFFLDRVNVLEGYL